MRAILTLVLGIFLFLVACQPQNPPTPVKPTEQPRPTPPAATMVGIPVDESTRLLVVEGIKPENAVWYVNQGTWDLVSNNGKPLTQVFAEVSSVHMANLCNNYEDGDRCIVTFLKPVTLVVLNK